jgi:drug/metabolite transporter (DMT)-like permease
MWSKLILISFFSAGAADTMFKVVIESGLGAARNSYILAYNCFALILGILFCRRKRIKPGRKEILAGAGTGICIGAGTMFGMKALMELPGIVYFPALSVGNLLLVTLSSRIFWKEKFSRRQAAGLLLALTSITLIMLP